MRLGEHKSLEDRLHKLVELDQARLVSLQNLEAMQRRRKAWHDRNIKIREFSKGDLVLIYDSRYYRFPGKLSIRWLGPFRVVEVFDNGSLSVQDINEENDPFRVNGLRVKHYMQ